MFIGECLKYVVINLRIVEIGLNTSDHMPDMFDFMVPTICFMHVLSARSQVKTKVLRWDKGNIVSYYQLMGELFGKIAQTSLLCW